MEDEEYPAYLKKQSYEDLLSIGSSIDKEAAAKRYEMLLTEIAERERRGERKEELPSSPPKVPVLLSIFISFAMLACSLAFGWHAVSLIGSGQPFAIVKFASFAVFVLGCSFDPINNLWLCAPFFGFGRVVAPTRFARFGHYIMAVGVVFLIVGWIVIRPQ